MEGNGLWSGKDFAEENLFAREGARCRLSKASSIATDRAEDLLDIMMDLSSLVSRTRNSSTIAGKGVFVG